MRINKVAAVWLLTSSVASSVCAAPASGSTKPVAVEKRASFDGAMRTRAAPGSRAEGTSSDEARYAARETASPGAKNYRAGDVVVISTTAIAIVLLVILIIILI